MIAFMLPERLARLRVLLPLRDEHDAGHHGRHRQPLDERRPLARDQREEHGERRIGAGDRRDDRERPDGKRAIERQRRRPRRQMPVTAASHSDGQTMVSGSPLTRSHSAEDQEARRP